MKHSPTSEFGKRPHSLVTDRLWVGLGLCCAAALLLSAVWKPAPLLVWNASPSVPRGFYRVAPGIEATRGKIVVAWLAPTARKLAAARGYLPWTVPLIKPVAAVTGDKVCAQGNRIAINGTLAAIRRDTDSRGRALPHWEGCVRLGRGEFFLLSAAPASFDGRYFGIVRAGQIVGPAEHL